MQKHILHIQAEESLASALATILERAGVVVLQERDAVSALRVLSEYTIDLVVIDSDIPGIGAFELLRSIRDRYAPSELAIAVIAGEVDVDTIHRYLDMGAADVVRKPILTRLLAHKLLKLTESVVRDANDFAPQATPTSDTYRLDFTRDHHELPDASCAFCHYALHHTAVVCEECNRARPHDGWTRLDKSGFPYLGRNVDRYYLERGIGLGATAQVYRGVDTSLGQRVAIKVIRMAQTGPVNLEEIKREVRAAAAIESPNVVAIWDVLTLDDEAIAVVMELARGKSLATMVHRDAAMPPPMALDLAQQVADALNAAHQCDIVHRDIKPENVIVEVGTSGRLFAKVVDFGIADIVGTSSRDESLFYGTPAYAAPEQIQDRSRIDPRTDIYGLGALLHHLLAGRPPFSGSTRDILSAQLHAPRPKLPEEAIPNVGLRVQLDAILDRAMAKSLDERFESVLEFNEAISVVQTYMRGRSTLPFDEGQSEEDLHPVMSRLLKDYLKP